MATTLKGKRIAFLVAPEGFEQVELTDPWKAVEECRVEHSELVSTEVGKVQAFNHLDNGRHVRGRTRSSPKHDTAWRYDGLVLPGGVANPDFLRRDAEAVGSAVRSELLRRRQAGGGDLPRPLDADRRGRGPRPPRLTSYDEHPGPICATPAPRWWTARWWGGDLGSTLVTSRKPDDLPAFCNMLVGAFAAGR